MAAATPAVVGSGIGKVFEHRYLQYKRTFRASIFSSFLTPVLFLTAMGLGLGTYVDDGTYAWSANLPSRSSIASEMSSREAPVSRIRSTNGARKSKA